MLNRKAVQSFVSAGSFCLVTFLSTTALGSSGQGWESQLFPFNSATGKYEEATVTPSQNNPLNRSWRLQDFSYAGYELGGTPLASGISCDVNNTVDVQPDGNGDIADSLEAAIESLAQTGGTVRIPAGSFTLSRAVGVPYSNISVQGAGSDLTLITVPDTYTAVWTNGVQNQVGLFQGALNLGKAVKPDAGGNLPPTQTWQWTQDGEYLAQIVAPVAEGDSTVTLNSGDAANVQVGDWVTVIQHFWSALSNETSNGEWPSWDTTGSSTWPPMALGAATERNSFTYLRQVTAISGTTATLDAPIPWPLDPANNKIWVLSATTSPSGADISMKENIGVAGFSLTFEDNTSLYKDVPIGAGVLLENVRDGWVYDVKINNAPLYGVRSVFSARITVRETAVQRMQEVPPIGVAGSGYPFVSEGTQNILIYNSYAENGRHNFISRDPTSSYLVYSGNRSALSRNADDTHVNLSHAVLWDQHDLQYGSAIHSHYRHFVSGGAHETNGSGVFWNVYGADHRGGFYGNSLQINPAASGYSIVVGAHGEIEVYDIGFDLGSGDRILEQTGLQIGALDSNYQPGPGTRDANVLYEGVGEAGLKPVSLYRAQLHNRLGQAPANFADPCGNTLTQGAITPNLDQNVSDGVLVFDSDNLANAPRDLIVGNNFDIDCGVVKYPVGGRLCDLDSPTHNQTPGGERSYLGYIEANRPGPRFTGPAREFGSITALRLSVRPTTSDLEFEVYLNTQHLPENLGWTTHAGVDVGPGNPGSWQPASWTLNDWNTIEIPMSAFGSPPPQDTFNMVLFGNGNSTDTSQFSLDDIQLVGAVNQCGNGIDDDGDGLTDLADPGCDGTADIDEHNYPLACNNGLDDDGDGLIDHGNDPGCDSAQDNDETDQAPADGPIRSFEDLTQWTLEDGSHPVAETTHVTHGNISMRMDIDGHHKAYSTPFKFSDEFGALPTAGAKLSVDVRVPDDRTGSWVGSLGLAYRVPSQGIFWSGSPSVTMEAAPGEFRTYEFVIDANVVAALANDPNDFDLIPAITGPGGTQPYVLDNFTLIQGAPACSDGVDNDGDGAIDLQDPSCLDANDTDEANPSRVIVSFENNSHWNIDGVTPTLEQTHVTNGQFALQMPVDGHHKAFSVPFKFSTEFGDLPTSGASLSIDVRVPDDRTGSWVGSVGLAYRIPSAGIFWAGSPSVTMEAVPGEYRTYVFPIDANIIAALANDPDDFDLIPSITGPGGTQPYVLDNFQLINP